jgi:carboxymethylenebutenolidase
MTEMGSMIDAGGVPSYLARPQGDGQLPGLLICFEAFGLNNNIKKVCERLAREGYVAIAPDFYHRQPAPRVMAYSDLEKARTLVQGLVDEEAVNIARTVINYLKAQPFVQTERIGVVGFCLGGRLGFLFTCRLAEDIKAAALFYGGAIASKGRFAGQTATPLEEADKISASMRLFFGGLDAHIPAEEVSQIEVRLRELKKDAEVTVYSQADHGFMCEERSSYSEEAALDAWTRTLRFLHHRLISELPS